MKLTVEEVPYRHRLGERIAKRRRTLGLTQGDLARRIGLREPTTVSRWERGERVPRNLEQLAQALEMDPEELRPGISVERSEPTGETQLDRIEQMVALLVYRQGVTGNAPAPPGELGRVAGDSSPTAPDRGRKRRPAAGDSR